MADCIWCGAPRNKRRTFCSKSCASLAKGGGEDARFSASYLVDPHGCWLWQKSTYGSGYGVMCCNRQRLAAHRYSYVKFRGAIPAGMVVMHKCDNPGCVNPDHLEIGTQGDNIHDCQRKGRDARGSRAGPAKLTEREAGEIRRSTEKGVVLAARYRISPSIITQIRNGQIWRHVQ